MKNIIKIYDKQQNKMLKNSHPNLEMVCKILNINFLTKSDGWDFD